MAIAEQESLWLGCGIEALCSRKMGDRRERKAPSRHASGYKLSAGKKGLQWQWKLEREPEDPTGLRVCVEHAAQD